MNETVCTPQTYGKIRKPRFFRKSHDTIRLLFDERVGILIATTERTVRGNVGYRYLITHYVTQITTTLCITLNVWFTTVSCLRCFIKRSMSTARASFTWNGDGGASCIDDDRKRLSTNINRRPIHAVYFSLSRLQSAKHIHCETTIIARSNLCIPYTRRCIRSRTYNPAPCAYHSGTFSENSSIRRTKRYTSKHSTHPPYTYPRGMSTKESTTLPLLESTRTEFRLDT